MASEEKIFNLSAHREVLRSFPLSDTETSVEHNLCHAHTHHDSLMNQWMPAEDAPEMTQVLDAEIMSVEQIIEEEQAHRVQMAALSKIQLQAMDSKDAQERSCRDLVLCWWSTRHFYKGPTKKPTQAPPENLSQLRHEVIDYLPGTGNTNRGAALKTGQVPDLCEPPTIKRDTLNTSSLMLRSQLLLKGRSDSLA